MSYVNSLLLSRGILVGLKFGILVHENLKRIRSLSQKSQNQRTVRNYTVKD
jgi:hypothetical protein